MLIRPDDLRGPEIAELLTRHLELMAEVTPRESIHALDLAALRAPEITFWTVWQGPDLMGCGALKELDPAHGEIKSMHTAARFRRRGVGAAMVRHILAEARRRAYRRPRALRPGGWKPARWRRSRPPARSTPASGSPRAGRSAITCSTPTARS